jgi:hypothetical protein
LVTVWYEEITGLAKFDMVIVSVDGEMTAGVVLLMIMKLSEALKMQV